MRTRDLCSIDEPELLYALDEPIVMIPREWCESRSKAAYRGWQELNAVSMIDVPFDPRLITVRARWMFRVTLDPWNELTHHYGDAWTPGAFKVWVVEVQEYAAPARREAATPPSETGS